MEMFTKKKMTFFLKENSILKSLIKVDFIENF